MLGSTIQREIAQMILRDMNDPRLPPQSMASVTRVKVSADLSVADVYVTIMGTPGQQTAGLNALRHAAGMMRTKLTKALALRVAPYVKFHLDEDLRKELDLMNVLQQVHEENAEIDRRRAAGAETPDAPNAPGTTGAPDAPNTTRTTDPE